MKSNKQNHCVSSTVLAFLFSTVILGAVSGKTNVKADLAQGSDLTTRNIVASSSTSSSVESDNNAIEEKNESSLDHGKQEEQNVSQADNVNEEVSDKEIPDEDIHDEENANKEYSSSERKDGTFNEQKNQDENLSEQGKKSEGLKSREEEDLSGRDKDKINSNGYYNPSSDASKVSKNLETTKNTGDKLQYDEDGNGFITNSNGERYKNQFVTYDNETFYTDENGNIIVNDWLNMNHNKYYFNYDGYMANNKTEEIYDKNNEQFDYYLFNKDGQLVNGKGWYEYKDTQFDDSYWVYFKDSEKLLDGWNELDGNQYYFYTGKMLENQLSEVYDDDSETYNYYAFDKNGHLIQTPGWHQFTANHDDKASWFYLNNQGHAATGWKIIEGNDYHFGLGAVLDKDGIFYTGNQIGDTANYYLFNQQGQLIKDNGWYKYTEKNNGDSYWVYLNKDHSLLSNFQKINGVSYYFDQGKMTENKIFQVYDGTLDIYNNYFARQNGQIVQNGWYYLDNSINGYGSGWIYAASNGRLMQGWHEIDGQTYFFNDDSRMVSTGINQVYDNDNWNYYLFENNGHLVQQKGWYLYDENDTKYWLYFNSDSSLKNGWELIGEHKYFFEDAKMLQNEISEVYNNSTGETEGSYLFDENGFLQVNGWYYFNGEQYPYSSGWVYANKDGKLATGWQQINGNNFYFDYNGLMAEEGITSVYDSINDEYKLYLFDKLGHLVTKQGWQQYTDKENGETSWIYLNRDNSLSNGWQTISGDQYYFENSLMVENCITSVYDSTTNEFQLYLFDKSGHLVTKQGWQQYTDKENDEISWIYLNSDNSLRDGWQTIGGNQYYFDNGLMVADGITSVYDSTRDELQLYLFDKSGHLITKQGWQQYPDKGNIKPSWVYINSDNSLSDGWQTIGRNQYYFDNGLMFSDGIKQVYDEQNNTIEYFLFDQSGHFVNKNGWYKYDNKNIGESAWIYFNQDGSLVNGWKIINGKEYFFEPEMASGIISVAAGSDMRFYLMEEDGSLTHKRGWYKKDTDWYYINDDGSLANGWKLINRQKYFFVDAQMAMDGVYSEWKDSEPTYYLFDWDGHQYNKLGFVSYDGQWYWVKKDGTLATEWVKNNNKYYYFDSENANMLANESVVVNNKAYLLDKNGADINSIGWHLMQGVYYYVTNNKGELATEWYQVGNHKYHFDYDGMMNANMNISADNKMYYADSQGYIVSTAGFYGNEDFETYVKSDGFVANNEWIKVNNKWYYADENGYLVKNDSIRTNNGKIYVFDESGQYFNKNGLVVLHNHYNSNISRYYLKNGVVLTNQWYKDHGKWYYADQNGVRMQNQISKDNHGVVYAFDMDGDFTSSPGWHKLSFIGDKSVWNYLDLTGKVLKNQWIKSGKEWYYVDSNGEMMTGAIMLEGGKFYYLSEDGKLQSNGWVKDGDSWYYLVNGKTVQVGWKKINNSWYYFDENGLVLTSTFVKDSGKYYTFDKNGKYSSVTKGWFQDKYNDWFYFDNKEKLSIGWQKINNSWYYFDESGEMYQGRTIYIKNKKYVFDVNGALIENRGLTYAAYGLQFVNSDGNSISKNSWEKLNGSWYYFDQDGIALMNGVYSINGQEYYFNEDGKNIEKNGWVSVNNNQQYYYFKNGHTLKKQWSKINNKWYYFDKDGIMAQGTELIGEIYYQFNTDGSWINS